MKDFKKIMVMIACVVLLWGQTVKAVALPILPYVPPADVQIMDVLHNAYGLTIPQIEDAEKRLEVYWNAYRAILGSAYDAFYADMQNVIDNAKTSRKITLSVSTQATISEVLKHALEDGYEYSESGEVTPPPSTFEEVKRWFQSKGYENIDDKIRALVNYNNRVTNKVYVILRTDNVLSGTKNVAFMACSNLNNGWVVHPENGNTFIFQAPSGVGTAYSYSNTYGTYNYNTKTYNQISSSSSTAAFGTINNMVFPSNSVLLVSSDTGTETKSIQALNADVAGAISRKEVVPITANTVINDGAIDTTKPVVIDMPIALPLPATTVTDMQNVLDDIGVVPISENPAQTVTQLKEEAAAKYGDTGNYAVDLTMYFPFCIPFDLVRIVSALDAEPEAPHFTFPLPSDIENGEVVFTEYEFSLDWMSPAMVWVRRGELVLGAIGVMLMTRDIIRG